MKKMYKKEEGVSPVIATILMVAITVVLAATVWLMVSGYMGGTGGNQITGSFASKQQVKPGYWELTFSQFQPDTNITTLKISISVGTTTYTVTGWTYKSATIWNATLTPTPNTLKLQYHDLAGNGVINSGDYLLISGVSGSVTVTILDSNGNQICSTSFTA
ncbi:archaeal flagellin-like protein [Aciduliprofundum sp. MAR08-339]|uniref:archaellin/type IV pilin N-terminal domain-containing protein n=1 Tax=Aciduliprofundum sp. (strain MAR08-339) TaxID=673860 RepID=UPI0002A494D3|nr:archaeal flagellin-like protein [Aciduliprofundum sp. MAR08-339]